MQINWNSCLWKRRVIFLHGFWSFLDTVLCIEKALENSHLDWENLCSYKPLFILTTVVYFQAFRTTQYTCNCSVAKLRAKIAPWYYLLSLQHSATRLLLRSKVRPLFLCGRITMFADSSNENYWSSIVYEWVKWCFLICQDYNYGAHQNLEKDGKKKTNKCTVVTIFVRSYEDIWFLIRVMANYYPLPYEL